MQANTMKLKQDKKAETFMKEFAAAGASSIDALAAKLNLAPEKMDGLVFSSYSVAGLGKEDVMCGVASAIKPNTLSKALQGQNAVYVVNVTERKPSTNPYNKVVQNGINASLSSRVDYEAFEAQKTLANIQDHKAKFDF